MSEKRALPKRTIVIIILMSLLALVFLYFSSLSKELKVKEYLHTLGLENVANIKVYNKSEANIDASKPNGYLFKIKFTNLDNNTQCKGLIFVSNKNLTKDIDCK